MSVQASTGTGQIPRQWYNLAADLPKPAAPPVGPDGKPLTPDSLSRVFPMNLIEQEMTAQRWVDIPEPVLELLSRWRPTPLKRATHLEAALKTPARIYFKDESVSPPGSHKPNSAVAQAWYNKQAGIRQLVTETGAGQWGSSLAFACQFLGLTCKIYMVRASFDQKPARKTMMRVWGGKCVASPSPETETGRAVLSKMPDTPGSLGIAISEAIEETVRDASGATRYALGSVLNHVLLHQTVIGLEAKRQLSEAGERLPDVVIGCAGGGSNFAGLAFPFMPDRLKGAGIRFVPTESTACPSMTRGAFAYDFGDTARMTPLLPMYTLGHNFIPLPIHAGGLRYHGMAPLVSAGIAQGFFEPHAYDQLQAFEAARVWASTEGPICAPETSHAIAAVIEEAERARQERSERVILFNYSGHGLMDLAGYEKYLSGQLTGYQLPEDELRRSLEVLRGLPRVPAA